MPEITIPAPFNAAELGVILVDHGSRRDESNDMLLDVVRHFAESTGLPIVEPAHMEVAEPSIATAFARCVARGAKTVVVFPYFLLPGRHWHDDIPNLTAAAAKRHPGIHFLVTEPFGEHQLMAEIICQRINHALAAVSLSPTSPCEKGSSPTSLSPSQKQSG